MKAATGEEVTAEELGGGDVHARISGVADHLAEDDAEALRRSCATSSPPCRRRRRRPGSGVEPRPPAGDPEEILDVVPIGPAHALRRPRGAAPRRRRRPAARVQGAATAKTLVCAFARIDGHPVGIVANNGILFSESALKGAHFVELCDQRRIPLLFLQNITGFMVGKRVRGTAGSPRTAPRWSPPSPPPAVPKLTVIVGGSFGAGNYAMCGRAYSPRFLFMWPNARISVMGGDRPRR